LATRSKCSTAPGSTTGIDLIGYPEQVLNSTWLNHRYTELIGYLEQVLNITWLNHRYTDLIGYLEQVLNITWLNHRYGSDWLPGASAQQHLAQPQVY
jgi:hypothetical protein